MWIAVTPQVSVFRILRGRGRTEAGEMIGKGFAGIASTDRYAAYHWLDGHRRQMCWARLKRDFLAIKERGAASAEIGEGLLKQVQEIFKAWHALKAGSLNREAFQREMASIRDEDADGHFRSQHTFVTDEEGKIGVDFIGRFERMAEDFRFIQERIGLPRNELPWLQKARAAVRYTDFYSNETRQIAGERFQQDIEMFGYEFGVA